jgi:hypothetical protein
VKLAVLQVLSVRERQRDKEALHRQQLIEAFTGERSGEIARELVVREGLGGTAEGDSRELIEEEDACELAARRRPFKAQRPSRQGALAGSASDELFRRVLHEVEEQILPHKPALPAILQIYDRVLVTVSSSTEPKD